MNTEQVAKPLKSLKSLGEQYIESLSEKERKAYTIAKEHLGMSFQLDKSVGYLKWLRTRSQSTPSPSPSSPSSLEIMP
jgi:hypothetical protein